MIEQLQDKFSRNLRDLRVSVTDRCNFRCPYCMPAEVYGQRYRFLPKVDILSFEEITRVVRIFVDLGVTKVRLTGGEPLVRKNLEKLVAMLSNIDGISDLTLTTNGYLLAQKAQVLKDAGLQRVTISLDSLDPEVFKQMNGVGHGPEKTLKGVEAAELANLTPIKINTVVKRHVNDHTIVDLAKYFKGSGHILRFIEYMDVGNLNEWKGEQVVSAEEIVGIINAHMPIEPSAKNYTGEVADRYSYVDGSGEIGIISSISKPFCGDCTRARLSTDGKVYTCLFGTSGYDIRESMRVGATDQQLKDIIIGLWRRRVDKYSQERATLSGPSRRKVEMYQIGG